MTPTTLAGKVWDRHVVERGDADLLYVDLHLLHELTSPQAFEGLSLLDGLSARQLRIQRDNCRGAGIELHPLGSPGQGIVHVIGPELGLTQPGMTIVCGDSHTATLGAFGAIAFGIGTSQVEHVLATQTLWMPRPRTMAVTVRGTPRPGTTAKDLTLAIIARIGTAGGAGASRSVRSSASGPPGGGTAPGTGVPRRRPVPPSGRRGRRRAAPPPW
ncbi:hypothetical protein ETD83_14525 [Actinomadura soli]|uniref:3-isopropylmalate dehydratase n=1 Tax=Actinomadura soli TaxID=2508997 RepID=A0A5C4JDC6_9ACTN|nr:hypothetical protein ETD83_14525 [Actinomadura soli]